MTENINIIVLQQDRIYVVLFTGLNLLDIFENLTLSLLMYIQKLLRMSASHVRELFFETFIFI